MACGWKAAAPPQQRPVVRRADAPAGAHRAARAAGEDRAAVVPPGAGHRRGAARHVLGSRLPSHDALRRSDYLHEAAWRKRGHPGQRRRGRGRGYRFRRDPRAVPLSVCKHVCAVRNDELLEPDQAYTALQAAADLEAPLRAFLHPDGLGTARGHDGRGKREADCREGPGRPGGGGPGAGTAHVHEGEVDGALQQGRRGRIGDCHQGGV
mmetsp:Transcript_106913/g.297733  ORF Transcript_106913/g.297733 Transcript_106913/m.297733 type:complete len:209 (-) Transcript_106913:678-1304(-)